MICSSCGVKNVEFASICFACRKPIGSSLAATATAMARAASPASTPREAAKRPSFPRALVVRLLFALAVLWGLGRGGFPIRDTLLALLASRSSEQQSAQTTEPDTAPEAIPEESHPAPIEERNGFRLVHFEWNEPPGGAESPFHAGETVSGRSEIQGFGVSADGQIDVTVALAFRDPTGALVEPVSPTVLRHPVESETLYTRFDYAIPADGMAGEYDLEIAVDDAVSTRSVRFHRTIAVEAATKADSPVEAESE